MLWGAFKGRVLHLGEGKPRIRAGWVMNECTESSPAEIELETLAGQKLDIIF